MKKLQHFILTRFNLGLYGNTRKDKNQQQVNNDGWMEERFELFDRFCFPSIHSQANQNFTWLVLFDVHTPPKYAAKIRKYQQYPNFVPLLSYGSFTKTTHVEGFADFHSFITSHLEKDTAYLITTRIDNDDALHRQATQLIQAQTATLTADSLAVDFPVGYCFYKDILYIKRQLNNPFLSLIEKIPKSDRNAPLHTVFWIKHKLIDQIAPVKRLDRSPMWIQVIHNRNLVNRAKGQPVPALLSPRDFMIRAPGLFKNASL